MVAEEAAAKKPRYSEMTVGSAVMVTVEIKEDRIDDFFKVMEMDSVGSRSDVIEPGCLRFDVLRSREQANKFVFYEANVDDAAAAHHKTTAHYNAWADFKKSGGVASQEVLKLDTASIPGGWAFQKDLGTDPASASAVYVTVDIKEDRIDDFLKAMEEDVTKSRDKALDPGCMRFDLLRSREAPNRFVFYEVYTDDAAAAHHKTTSHYKAWADFKASGGVDKQDVLKLETASIPGTWAFQSLAPPSVKVGNTYMPLLGFGTYKVGAVPASASAGADAAPGGPDVCNQVISDALNSGYVMLDCAQFYMNEQWVGDAIKKSGKARSSIFIAGKVWNDTIYNGPDAVKAQVQKSIDELQCDYLDMMLVHWPVPGKHVAAYNALRECKKLGKVKNIGVSNYTAEDMEELKAAGAFGDGDADKPTMNQIEVNPLLFRKNTLAYFKKEGIHVQSYRGLMQGPKAWETPGLQEVCKETGKSPAQVLGRFLVQQGISHVPKASAVARMNENADIFSFQLSSEQIEKLSNLTKPEALENFKALYTKCIWRDTPEAGSALPGERTID